MDRAVQHALKVGADFAEVKGEETITRNIEAVNKEIRTVSEIRNIGVGVRVFYRKGKRIFFLRSVKNARAPELRADKALTGQLVSEIKDGVLVKGSLIGALHSNRVTSDFSVTADNAFKIENGKVAYPLKACTVAGNLYEALNSVVTTGNDLKSFTMIHSANVVCPSVVVDKIVVSP